MSTITQLEYLLAVDRFRHFGRAAKECHVTQPSLSMQLQKLEDEKLYSGCNIENASFGGCMCAERVSLYKAYTESPAPKKLVEKVLLITDNPQYDVPCGLCLQVLSEFSDQNTEIYLANLKGVVKTLKFSQLLPESFSKESLPGHKS